MLQSDEDSHTLMIFSTQQHHYPGFQWGLCSGRVFHSTFELGACLYVCLYVWASSVSVIFSSTLVTLPHTAPHLRLPSLNLPLNTTNFSTICCHCDQSPFHRTSHLTEMACSKAIPYLVQMNSWTNLWSLLPQCPSPMPLSLCLLHLCTSSSSSSVSSPVVCLFSNWSHISSTVCWMNPLPAPPPLALSPPFTSLSLSAPPPHPYIHPPPTRPVATAVLLQFMGSLQQLPVVEGKGRGGRKEEWWETTGEETWENEGVERK